MGDERTRERIREVRVEEKMDLDHRPITVWLEGSERQGSREDKRRGIRIWTEENKEKFRVMFGERRGEKEDVEKEWERLRVKESLKKIEEKDRKEEKKGWWDRECKEGKLQVRAELRKWRKGGGNSEEYREKKLRYKRMCEEKKKKEIERCKTEIKEARSEAQVWKILNKERKRRKKISEEIEE